jgi:hypothetical protein
MMGANWKYDRQHQYLTKYAWFPTRSTSGKFIWLTEYHIRLTYYDHNGKPPLKGQHFLPYIYTKNEFLINQIKGA